MQPDLLTADRLAEVISHAVATAFLLGAVAGFISILTMRMGGIIDRIRSLNAIAEGDTARGALKADIPRLKRRTRLLNQAVYLALASGICGTLLIMIAFASAFLGVSHEPFVALLFIVSVSLLGVSLYKFACEVKIALHEYDHF
ncbi:MAG: DUF2721 domain-containing protein [Dongiaceae bacterium]